ncbi:SPOR domain-containing protein [Streptomyces alboniger]|uniref:SPOR domain-containing protein n=1 Tax=Streptomyces alboniger TaxID=132473 RepID=A0A5J6HN98_STRAD|nr:SPOR domain-containing protein [Streptomyces alboniger]QEV20014.1 SPOR domain-containing protein [Streptomyces alboniger]
MNDGTVLLPWFVIRQDDNGNRYRVGRFATKAEAQRIADSLDDLGPDRRYSVEKLNQNGGGRQ